MMVSRRTPAPARAGITELPMPPAPITATLAALSLRCPTPPTCGRTMWRAYRSSSASERAAIHPPHDFVGRGTAGGGGGVLAQEALHQLRWSTPPANAREDINLPYSQTHPLLT